MAKKSPNEGSGRPAPESGEELLHARERARFRALLLSNPNYFGNLKESPIKPVLKIKGNTTYEEICSVGFQPQFDRLEAVVYVTQPTGYGGDICSQGTPEYVRFYASTDNGNTWEDLGAAGFTAFDISEGTERRKRLEYAVTLKIDPRKTFCFVENIVLVRAILSWNQLPPENDPDFIPVWGNVHNTHIQIDPRHWVVLAELFETVKVKTVPQLSKVLDLVEPVKAVKPPTLSVMELAELYKGKEVEPHRFGLQALQGIIDKPTHGAVMTVAGAKALFPQFEIDWDNLGDLLAPAQGDTRYEALECIGLDPNLDTMVGVIRVKLPSGYSGGLCTAGSREYVTFWADFNNNGTFETCLGTTSVGVHDIEHFPKEGLEYAVFLPVALDKYRQPCEKGPRVVRIRAILSWQHVPPCWNPNYVPVWGNRLETLIHIKPGPSVQPGSHFPIIQTVGSMDVGDINPVSGLADGPAVLAGFTADDSPFGGWVIVTGHIGDPPDISAGAPKLKYRVEVSADGFATMQTITNPFTLYRDQLLNGIWSDLPAMTQSVDGDGWYEYQEDLKGSAQIFPVGNVLARWQTGGLDGVRKLRIRVKHPVSGLEWLSNVVTLKLDNTSPSAAITITSGGGACADFTIGDKISGTYSATDLHFHSLRLRVLPALGGSFTGPSSTPGSTTMPVIRTYAGGVPTTGESGAWKLDTKGMPRCGYVIYLDVWDRTIRNSGFIGHHTPAVVGLCLREPGK